MPDSKASMTTIGRFACLLLAIRPGDGAARGDEPPPRPTARNVVPVTTGGLRRQGVFRGAGEAPLEERDGGVADGEGARPADRRRREAARSQRRRPGVAERQAGLSRQGRRGRLVGRRPVHPRRRAGRPAGQRGPDADRRGIAQRSRGLPEPADRAVAPHLGRLPR